MFKLVVNNSDLVSARLDEVRADLAVVADKLELSNFFGEEVEKLLKSKRKQIVEAVEDYATTGVVAAVKQGVGKFKKPTLVDFVVIKLLQYVYGVAVANLGVVTNQSASQRVRPGEYPEGNIPYMRGGPIFAYIDHPNPHVGEAVVITGLGYAGQVKYFNEPIVIAESLIMDPVPGISHGRFLYHSLKWREFYFNRYCGGTGISSIPKAVLLPQSVALPEFEMQKQIAAKFDQLTDELEQLGTQLNNTRGTYYYFKQKLVEPPVLDPALVAQRIQHLEDNFDQVCLDLGFEVQVKHRVELLAQVKAYQPEIGLYEYSIELLRLLQYVYEFVAVSIDSVSEQFSAPLVVASKQQPGPIPLIANGTEVSCYITHDKPHLGEAVVIARVGSAGSVTYWQGPVVISDAFAAQAKKSIALTKYFYYAASNIEHYLKRLASGTTVPSLPVSVSKKQLIQIPSLQIQREVVEKLTNLEQLIDNLERKREALQKIYNYALDQTFSGTYGEN